MGFAPVHPPPPASGGIDDSFITQPVIPTLSIPVRVNNMFGSNVGLPLLRKKSVMEGASVSEIVSVKSSSESGKFSFMQLNNVTVKIITVKIENKVVSLFIVKSSN
jgi:hypothetical protein